MPGMLFVCYEYEQVESVINLSDIKSSCKGMKSADQPWHELLNYSQVK